MNVSTELHNNNNTGHLLHAIYPKSEEHIACYKHIRYHYIQELLHCRVFMSKNHIPQTEIVMIARAHVVKKRGP